MKVVVGAGTMGIGIAESFILSDYETVLYDPFKAAIENAESIIPQDLQFMKDNKMFDKDIDKILENLSFSEDLEKSLKHADFIVECAPEDLQIKLDLFDKINKFAPKESFIGSNTSSLPFKELIQGISHDRKSKFIMCHFYNPANIMPLVELSYYGNMSEEDFIKIEKMFKNMEKVTVRILKEVPGLVANRIQQSVAREVFYLMQNEIASPEDIDKALTFGPAFRYATSGQLQIADMGGLDIWCTVGDNLLSVMDNSKKANDILRDKVKENKLGIKSGEGFFSYPDDKKAEIKKEYLKKLIRQLNVSKTYIK